MCKRIIAADKHCLLAGDVQFRAAFEYAPACLAIVDVSGTLLSVNASLCRLLGAREAELLNRDWFGLINHDDAATSRAIFARCVAGENSEERIEVRFADRDVREIIASVGVSLVRDPSANPLYFVLDVRDETESQRANWLPQDRLEALEMVAQDKPLPVAINQILHLLGRQMPEAGASVLLLQDGAVRQFAARMPQAMLQAINRRPVSFIAGLTSELAGGALPLCVADVEAHPAWKDLRNEARMAEAKCCWALTIRGNDGATLGLFMVLSQERLPPTPVECEILSIALHLATISIEHHQTTRQLAHLVRHDPLTGLPNRVLLDDRLQQALAAARRNNKPLGLLALDLNRFKQVNDTLGHQAGDALLQQFALRLRGKLRESDTLARVGGDEFLVILPEATSRQDAEDVADRLRSALASAPFVLGKQSLAVTSSIGIAMFPDDADDTSALQRAADEAMYRAKEQARNSAA